MGDDSDCLAVFVAYNVLDERRTHTKRERSLMSLHLNYEQERELYRMLVYESRTCARNGKLVYHCAFPTRLNDALQQELVNKGMLERRADPARGPVVVITSDGYSYFPELDREEERELDRRRHERGLVVRTAIFCIVCLVVGVLLGHFLG